MNNENSFVAGLQFFSGFNGLARGRNACRDAQAAVNVAGECWKQEVDGDYRYDDCNRCNYTVRASFCDARNKQKDRQWQKAEGNKSSV